MEIMSKSTINQNLHIGFATKFFTLWTVTSEETFGQSTVTGRIYPTGTKTNFTFHQNLSKDETKAIAKAESMGCVNLTPDPELRGKTRSWSKTERIEIEPEFFRFGKYRGEKISESTDYDYLKWYLEECQNDQNELVGSTIGSNLDGYQWKKGQLVDVEFEKQKRARRRLFNKIRKAGKFEFFNERNIRVHCGEKGFSMLEIPELNWSFVIDQEKQPVGVYNYNGFEYGLPDGTRIKNKNIRVTFEFDPEFEGENEELTNDWLKLLITKIEKI